MHGGDQLDPVAERVAALARLPVGAALAAALAALDLSTLTGSQCVDVLTARYRQSSHDRGELFATITEVIRRTDASSARSDQWPLEFAADEVRAALVLTRAAAEGLCGLADDVRRRLPAVQQAFAAGVLDQPRVRVFSEWTLGLSDEHTEAIVARLLPEAPQLTTAQLIDQIKRNAIALDPDWAERRYRQGIKGRRVVGYRNQDGTANLAGYDLPVDRVAASSDRFDRLAKAAKQAGHPDPIDHLRADLFLGMTDGTYAGLTDDQVLTRILADANLTPPAQPDDPAPDADDADDGSAGGEAAADASAGASAGDLSTVDSEADSGEEPADETGGQAGDPGDGASPADPPDGDGRPGPGDGAVDGGAEPDARRSVGRSGGLRMVVGLATLAGADRRPAELLGWGPVHAEAARAMANTPGASWWYVLTGPDGAPISIGHIRTRPNPPTAAGGGGGCRGLQVWIQVNQTTLDTLATQTHPPGWDRILAEIIARAQTSTGPPNGDPRSRLPGAALRRWIQVRDRACVFPGCRVPAHRADADHSIEHAAGGDTIDANLGPSCRHDHRLRHEGGWTLTQTAPGHFRWTSRLGHTYHRKPPPDLSDLPDPMPTPPSTLDPIIRDPDDAKCNPQSTEDWIHDVCMQPEPRQPRAQEPSPPSAPASSREDDIPPF